MSQNSVLTITKELFKGHSLTRSLMAPMCKGISISGDGVDLGSKDGSGIQYRYMDHSQANITFTDISPKSPSAVAVDLEGEPSLPEESFDFVLMFFVLEHVFNYRSALSHAYRLVKPGGRLVGAVPLMERYHPDPDDYTRFTVRGVERNLEEHGFTDISVRPIGVGPFTAATHVLSPALLSRWLRFPLGIGAMSTDMLMRSVLRRNHSQIYALSTLFEASKPNVDHGD